MRYIEFKEGIKCWGQKYGYVTGIRIEESNTYIMAEFNGVPRIITIISNVIMFVLDTDWPCFKEVEEHARSELINIILELAKTPPIDRGDGK